MAEYADDSFDAFALDVADDLEQTLELFIHAQSRRVEHVDEVRSVGFHLVGSEFLNCLGLCQTDVSNWRVRENHGWDVGVVHLQSWFVVENTLSNNTALTNCNWGQLGLVRDVTDCINSRDSGVLELIDFDSVV